MIVALNTSFESPAVAAGQHGRLLAAACAPGWPADLTELTVQVLSQGRRAALDGVVVATGPGRFGAVRGGIAFAKGLALARGAPLVGVPTALAVIEAAGTGDATVVLPAGRGRWYVASSVEDSKILLMDADELARTLPDDGPVAGPLDAALARSLSDRGRQVLPVNGEEVLGALVRLAQQRIEEGRGPARLGAQPVYAAPATRARRWTGAGVGIAGRSDG